MGEPTLYWTWYPGCAWQAALCRACGVQVGWRYSGAAEFFGLMKNRIAM